MRCTYTPIHRDATMARVGAEWACGLDSEYMGGQSTEQMF